MDTQNTPNQTKEVSKYHPFSCVLNCGSGNCLCTLCPCVTLTREKVIPVSSASQMT